VRDDGKRPDGSTLIPQLAGKSLAWDVTVVNTVAESCISVYTSPGGAAEHAAARKSLTYSSLPSSRIFQPLALETFGPINSTGISFSAELGCRLTNVSYEPHAVTRNYKVWLKTTKQHIKCDYTVTHEYFCIVVWPAAAAAAAIT